MAADGQKPALISVRQTTEDSKWLGKVDPKTERPIAVGDQVVLCPKCYTPQLLSSWRENGDKCALDETPARVIERPGRAAGDASAAPRSATAPAEGAPAAGAAPAGAAPAPAPAAAPASAAPAPTPAAAVPAEPIDPYRYALPVDAPEESSVWRGNIMTIVVLLVLWGLVVFAYTMLVAFGLLPGGAG
jgi:nucleoid-associated protein YgaU